MSISLKSGVVRGNAKRLWHAGDTVRILGADSSPAMGVHRR